MNRDAEIRIAMAKLAGWTDIVTTDPFITDFGDDRPLTPYGNPPTGSWRATPRYLKDLSATRSMILDILNLATSQLNWEYCRILGEITGSGANVTTALVLADAKQHCEAILKTTGNWDTKWENL
jgi:hypothetical protein